MATTKPANFVSGSTEPGGTYVTYKGGDGMAAPDQGKGAGPGIPYQPMEHKVPKKVTSPTKKRTEAAKKKKTVTAKSKTKDKVVRAQRGDSISKIASKYGMSWQELYKYNTTKGKRNAKAISTLKKRGPNLIYKGTAFKIPAAKLDAIKRRQAKK